MVHLLPDMRHKCQRQCSSKGGSFKSKAGDEHWTKYLQASEENSHLLLNGTGGKLKIQHSCSCGRNGSTSSSNGKSPKDNIFSSLYSRFTDWVSTKRDINNTRTHSSGSHSRQKSCRHRKVAERPNGFGQDFPDFFQHHPHHRHSGSSTRGHGLSPVDSHYHQPHHSYSPVDFLHCNSPVSSQCSDHDSLHLASSTCSSYTVISTPSLSGLHTPNHCQYYSPTPTTPNSVLLSPHHNAQELARHYPDLMLKLLEWRMHNPDNNATDQCRTSGGVELIFPNDVQVTDSSRAQSGWYSERAQRSRKRRKSTHSRKLERQKSAPLWKTWPSIEQDPVTTDPVSKEDTAESTLCDVTNQSGPNSSVSKLSAQNRTESQQSDTDRRDPLTEFSIAYDHLQFGECVRRGNTRNIFTGKWFGDVVIHCYHDVNEEERCNFWRTVSQLGKIRHENVVLYMGACLEEPNFAVVTSIRKGISLYEHIHIKGEKNAMFSSLNVARQISQAMGYLHAKGVVVQTLNSRNISLEPKVKLCLMDHSFPETKHTRVHRASVPRGNLSYMAPELLRSCAIDKLCLVSRQQHSEMSDVYAFGTLLYELSTGKFPLAGTLPECLIYQVCSGKRACLKHITVKHVVKNLIQRCWSQEPMKRPEFEEINNSLQQHGSIHKKQSSSDPENLHKTGLQRMAYSQI